ncbi:phosphatases II [Pyrrhoderma noxium]|uniref:Phosphatases II n=1 Tax=Pyrrhoderma noxium TaxID=2282107 RepID=A0A286UB79_9AGAM|nr:phosphatases II [Pyrrhoderma noxium]
MIRADAFPPDVWESICTPMHLILPGDPSGSGRGALYLGSWTAAVDNDLLARHRVNAIVECHDAPWGACDSHSSSSEDLIVNGSMTPTLARSSTSTSQPMSSIRPPLSRSASSSLVPSYSNHSNGSNASGIQQAKFGRFKVAIADSAAPDVLAPHLDDAVRFIRDRLTKGENVLVHCQQGISRSPAIVTAFLMREQSIPYEAALHLVKSRRKCVKPNAGFEKTLRSWK